MRLNEKFLEKIDKNYSDKHRNGRYKNCGLGINVRDGFSGATVFKNNWAICELDELQQMIDELEMMKQAIEEETGICF